MADSGQLFARQKQAFQAARIRANSARPSSPASAPADAAVVPSQRGSEQPLGSSSRIQASKRTSKSATCSARKFTSKGGHKQGPELQSTATNKRINVNAEPRIATISSFVTTAAEPQEQGPPRPGKQHGRKQNMLVYNVEESAAQSAQSIRKDVQDEVALSRQKRFENFINRLRGDPTHSVEEMRHPTLVQQVVAEAIGTCAFVTFGLGVNAATIIAGAHSGLLAAAIVWGVAVGFGVLVSVSVSGGHINPAASVTFALLRPHEFPMYKLLPYICGQVLGAIVGGFIIYIAFGNTIAIYEAENGIVRGEAGSEVTASVFCGFNPNPPFVGDGTGWTDGTITNAGAFGVEAFCTGFLMFCAFALTDKRNHLKPGGGVIAFGIGLSVTLIVAVFAALDGTSINPARDFGPRFVAAVMGWGTIAMPGPNGAMWAYILGPLVGGPIGGAIYDLVLMRGF